MYKLMIRTCHRTTAWWFLFFFGTFGIFDECHDLGKILHRPIYQVFVKNWRSVWKDGEFLSKSTRHKSALREHEWEMGELKEAAHFSSLIHDKGYRSRNRHWAEKSIFQPSIESYGVHDSCVLLQGMELVRAVIRVEKYGFYDIHPRDGIISLLGRYFITLHTLFMARR